MTRRKLFRRIEKLSVRPGLFETEGERFWTDPYISKHVLNAHLDPDIDDASRNHETVRASARWIVETTGGTPGLRLLDLGCGPGLYCREFSRRDCRVTGIDHSDVSISYAKAQGFTKGHEIEYRCMSFLDISYEGRFDVVTLIYGEFCVLSNADRNLLMEKIRRALRPGGFFVFDVFTESYIREEFQGNDWFTQARDGFWHRGPHLTLLQTHTYEFQHTYLKRYIVVPSMGRIRSYDLWYRPYDRASITGLMEAEAWEMVGVYGDLTGTPFDAKGPWIGVVCRKPMDED